MTAAAVGAAALALIVGPVTAVGQVRTGPSSSESPYIVPPRDGVTMVSLLTVADTVRNADTGAYDYRMAGLADGLGAFDNRNGTFTILMNHEIVAGEGRIREHGANGAFVSRWTIDKRTLRVIDGEDLIERVALAPLGAYTLPATGIAMSRLCSADLPAPSAFYNARSGRGYPGRLFLNGEEIGNEGRAFAHAMDGTSYELPYLGKMSWENAVANPATGNRTVVIGLDDSRPGQVYIYAGDKQRTGNPAQRAGLAGGRLYGIKVNGAPFEPAAGLASGTHFTVSEIETPHLKTGAQIDTESTAEGVTRWARPEDGAWDPRHPNRFYWVTTGMAPSGGFPTTNPARLWRFNFVDPARPELGGTVDLLLDGTEGAVSMDNLTVDDGQVVIQEDPGGNPRLARVWSYGIRRDTLVELARHDPNRFEPGSPAFLTIDEESSGIIPLDHILGEGWYALDSQVHEDSDPETVELGQLLLMRVKGQHHRP